ncbi:MAG: minor capsid protein [Methanobrevibacter sp.]|uniref:phage head morphogenesis protein n=1 Tax=Methanobrevibacter sp. TaxID=66852 RepID=UPI0025FB16C2|nr:minor capsid protein [Methanobrevibacter sp.]MBR0272379.1 minor capsid protein [Methanobrevibacter sp.]
MITSTEDRISTNKLLLDIIDFDKDLFDTSTLSTEEIRYYNSITRGFDKQLQFFIDWLDSDEARRIFYENESYNERVFEKIDNEIKSIVGDTSLTADEIISHIYDSGLQHGADEIRRTKYYNDATKFGLEFLQDYNFSLISNVNEDLKNHIRAEIFIGIAASESMPEVAKRILDATDNSLTGKTLSARQRAMMIARTETARAMTQGRLQSYANYGVQEVKILTAGDDNVCAICRKAADKIYPIEEASNLVPFHPLCRCSVTAYIRHGILIGNPLVDASIVNLTPQSFMDKLKEKLRNIRRKFQYRALKTPEDVAKFYKLEYRMDGNKHIFKDKLNGTEIIIDEYYVVGEGAMRKYIDFTNSGNGKYNLKEIIKIYEDAPQILKKATNQILFTKILKNKPNVCGSSLPIYDGIIKGIKIHPRAFECNIFSRGNVAQTLYHEMGHCLDYSLMNQISANAWLYPQYFTNKELRKIYNGEDRYSISKSMGFQKACEKDRAFQYLNGFPIEESSWYGATNQPDNWAETVSMVAFNEMDNVDMAVLEDYHRNSISLEEWKKRNPYKYNFALKKINEIKMSGFTMI